MKIVEMIKQNSYNTISIIGTAKNSGKTTTLNYLIEECYNAGVTIGLTSSGRDGETQDLVTKTEKPTIYVYEGTLAAIAKNLLELCTAKLEIIQSTNIHSPMGEIIITKTRQSGFIQIAGATSSKEMKHLSQLLLNYGADIVLIDGAIDRKAVSSPIITDACILATGAVVSRDLNVFIEKTAYAVERYSLKQADATIINIINQINSTCIISSDLSVKQFKEHTSMLMGKEILSHIDEHTAYIFIKGALTTTLLKQLCSSSYINNIKLIVEDGTKIFVEKDVWKEFKRKGLSIEASKQINLLAITINPTSPEGYFFDSEELIQQLKRCIPEIKIIDVKMGGE